MFANGLRARTDLACLNALISVLPAANDAVPGTNVCSKCSKSMWNSSCIKLLKAYWLPDALTGLTYNNYTFYLLLI
jgi:hypothetical protein